MTLFEDWYITIQPDITVRYSDGDELKKDEQGDYYYTEVYWMHKAFLAGQILKEKKE